MSMCLPKFFMGTIIKDNSIKHLKEDGAKERISALTLRKANSLSGSNKFSMKGSEWEEE